MCVEQTLCRVETRKPINEPATGKDGRPKSPRNALQWCHGQKTAHAYSSGTANFDVDMLERTEYVLTYNRLEKSTDAKRRQVRPITPNTISCAGQRNKEGPWSPVHVSEQIYT
jgi:hypothetical protein